MAQYFEFFNLAKASEQALALYSGERDSSVCLAWAFARFDQVGAIGFDYSQRHAVEMKCRKRIVTALVKYPG